MADSTSLDRYRADLRVFWQPHWHNGGRVLQKSANGVSDVGRDANRERGPAFLLSPILEAEFRRLPVLSVDDSIGKNLQPSSDRVRQPSSDNIPTLIMQRFNHDQTRPTNIRLSATQRGRDQRCASCIGDDLDHPSGQIALSYDDGFLEH
ncbi:hypothetical protein [Sphingomonas sp. 3-13AW]|uniref:hypothetical protein n=1 Tax=Sphingomonas sp. 3-13AW TaxID=3050450 RepID=UPI003BB75C8E